MTHIFISYSHAERDFAHQLYEALRQADLPVWWDDRIAYGQPWAADIENQLASCGAFVLIMTPDASESDWVRYELNSAIQAGKPVFPLLLAGEAPWAEVETIQYVDVRDRELPPLKFFTALARALERGRITAAAPQAKPTRSAASRATPLTGVPLDDDLIETVRDDLERLTAEAGADSPLLCDVVLALQRLFNRKTFRFEPVQKCTAQNWADRLHAACQTAIALQVYEGEVQRRALDVYPIFSALVGQVERYCMRMADLLFDPALNIEDLQPYVGQEDFKAHLLPPRAFPKDDQKYPRIPEAIVDQLEEPRLEAIALVDRLVAEVCQARLRDARPDSD
jgi:hypothetical protein